MLSHEYSEFRFFWDFPLFIKHKLSNAFYSTWRMWNNDVFSILLQRIMLVTNRIVHQLDNVDEVDITLICSVVTSMLFLLIS